MTKFKRIDSIITSEDEKFIHGIDYFNDDSEIPWMQITDWYHANAWRIIDS